MLVLYLLAVVLGIAVCLQGTANGLLAGRIGLPLALSINSGAAVAYPRLGASTTTALAVASQVVTALILDRLGATGQRIPLGSMRVLGLALVAVGVALVLGVGSKTTR